jgi:hypothetical protein
MTIKSIKDLVKTLAKWVEQAIPSSRLMNDASGRPWFLKTIEYTGKLTLADLRKVTDRAGLNDKYTDRFVETDVKGRKGISAIKVEISALYGFNKSFVERYKGRMHYYRDDLSQKGARNMTAVGQSCGMLLEFGSNLD